MRKSPETHLHPFKIRCQWDAALAGVAITFFLLFRIPSVEDFLKDPDGGAFLLGSLHILKAAEFPIVDFFFSYGPMAFFNSTAGQWLSNERAIGDIAVCTAMYFAAYALLYSAIRRLSDSRTISMYILVVALFLFPRFYKYFTVLLPSMWVLCMSYHHGHHSTKSALIIGAVAAYACLYRHDYAVFMGVSFIGYLAVQRPPATPRHGTQAIRFMGGFLLAMAPWIVFLIYSGSLSEYFSCIYTATFSKSVGLSRPHPLLYWTDPLLSLAYLFFFSMPVVISVVLMKSTEVRSSPAFPLYVSVTIFALVNLVQSSHRADLSHLLQGIPATLLCAAMAWRFLPRASIKAVAIGISSMFLCVFVAKANLSPVVSLERLMRCVITLSLPKQSVLDIMRQQMPDDPQLRVIRFIKSSSGPDQRVNVFPFQPQILYWAERLAAGRTLLLAPGYFDAPRHQLRMIEAIQSQDVPFILWNENVAFDNRPERNPVRTHGLLHEWLRYNYEAETFNADYVIFRKRSPDGKQRLPLQSGTPKKDTP